MGRLIFAAACGLLLLSACGARTGQLPPWITDGGNVKVDAPTTDGPPRVDGRPPPDRNMHDACLPIPAAQVSGSYSGLWKGTWRCPSTGPQPVSGTLYFSLTPSGGAESFKVVGAMNGMVSGTFMPFSTNITGTMGCTALSAGLPYIKVGSGGLMILLSGSMQGAFSVSAGKPGFVAGSWSAVETGVTKPCKASGSWQATQ
jgi:hypothetical protein